MLWQRITSVCVLKTHCSLLKFEFALNLNLNSNCDMIQAHTRSGCHSAIVSLSPHLANDHDHKRHLVCRQGSLLLKITFYWHLLDSHYTFLLTKTEIPLIGRFSQLKNFTPFYYHRYDYSPKNSTGRNFTYRTKINRQLTLTLIIRQRKYFNFHPWRWETTIFFRVKISRRYGSQGYTSICDI